MFLGIEAMTSAFGGSGTPSLRHYAATPTALVDTTQLVTQTLIYAAIATAVQTHTPQETPKPAPQSGRNVQKGIILLTLAIGAADFVACYGLLGPLSVHWPVYEAGLVALLMGELILAVPLPSHATAAIRRTGKTPQSDAPASASRIAGNSYLHRTYRQTKIVFSASLGLKLVSALVGIGVTALFCCGFAALTLPHLFPHLLPSLHPPSTAPHRGPSYNLWLVCRSAVALFMLAGVYVGVALLWLVPMRRFEVDLDQRTYVQRQVERDAAQVGVLRQIWIFTSPLVFQGSLDTDLRGLKIKTANHGYLNALYYVTAVWNDDNHPLALLSQNFGKLSAAQSAMREICVLLQVPALELLDE